MTTAQDPPGNGPPAAGHGGLGDDSSMPNEAAFDPYYLYGEATSFRFVRGSKDDFVPILLELRGPLHALLNGSVFLPDPQGEFIRISPLYTQAPEPLRATPYVTALVRREFFKRLKQGTLKFVRRFEYCAPLTSPQAWPKGKSAPERKSATPAQLPQASVPGRTKTGVAGPSPVLVGIIDDAIGFAHHRFRMLDATGAHKTRLHAFWDQGDDPARPGAVGTAGPLPSQGVILDRATIDMLLAQSTFAGNIDDDHVYALAGPGFSGDTHKNRGRRAGHGTHVLDLAAGEEPGAVSGATPIIAAVQLPIPITADSSGVRLTSYALDGLWWIAEQALLLGPSYGVTALPCVVNLSYGTLSGPHDGSELFTRAVDFLIRCWRTVLRERLSVVLPAGNGHLSATHAQVALPPSPAAAIPTILPWRVLPDTRTPSFMEIWLPYDTASREVEIRVAPPGQSMSKWIAEADPPYDWPSGTPPLLRVTYAMAPSQLGLRRLILVAVFPTAAQASDEPVAPWGTWRIELRNVGSARVRTVDAWIRRNDTVGGYPIRGRQSRFDDDQYVDSTYAKDGRPQEMDDGVSMVRRAGSINGLATGTLPVVVGGCRRGDLSAAPYTAGGPTLKADAPTPAPRLGADAMAPSDRSYVRAGILAAGLSGARAVALRGTSVAAPQVTRLIAQLLRLGANGSQDEIGFIADVHEQVRGPSIEPNGPYKRQPPPERSGSGRIDTVRLPPANRFR